MPKTYKISAENAAEIKEVRKTITDKKVDRRLYAVQLRGEGLMNDEIAQKLDTSDKMVSQWVSAYINNGGISALLPKERIGMHRNLSIEEEKEFLSAYTKQAEAGQIIDLNELKAAYIEKVGHSINIELIFIPPYTPEMNPIEQIWKEIRKRGFKNEVFQTLQKVVDRLCDTICSLSNETIKSITARDWILSCF